MSCLQPFLQGSVSEVIKSPAGLAVSKKKKEKKKGAANSLDVVRDL